MNKKKPNHFFNNSGQTLIEVLVALGIIGVVVTAISSVVISSLGNAQFSKNQSLATQFAQEALETVRQARDSDYQSFRSLDGAYCLDKSSSVLKANCPVKANVDSFFRQVTITPSGCSSNVSLVKASVSWQDSRCNAGNPFCHSAQLSTCLSSVNPVPVF